MQALARYLQMERVMLDLDEAGLDELAERCRSVMDKLWLSLSDAEIAFLNERDDVLIEPILPRRSEFDPTAIGPVWIAA